VNVVREASELLFPAVRATLASLGISTADGSKDAAAAKLALQYAITIDRATPGKDYEWALRWLGPELHKVLESLGATPAARAAMTKTRKPGSDDKPTGLRALRDAREA